MSNFMSSIIEPGPAFTLYPPESKVSPLPTSARIGAPGAAPPGGVYVKWMNLGGSSEASETARKAPIPLALHSAASRMVQASTLECCDASDIACSAKWVGVHTFGGEFTSRFAARTPSAVASAARSEDAQSSCEAPQATST